MFSLVAVTSVLLATALPTASAWMDDNCDDVIIRELYREPLPIENTFNAYGNADAEGDNSDTTVDMWLFQESGNTFSAYLSGESDDGVVYVFNKGYGATVDCVKVGNLVIRDVPLKDRLCVTKRYKVEQKACSKASAHFFADGFALGDGDVAVTTDSVQTEGGSATSQSVVASGSEGAGASASIEDIFENKDGNVSTASANTNVVADGNAHVDVQHITAATGKSSQSNTSIGATSTGRGKRRLLL